MAGVFLAVSKNAPTMGSRLAAAGRKVLKLLKLDKDTPGFMPKVPEFSGPQKGFNVPANWPEQPPLQQYFFLFFPDHVCDRIVAETNAYAKRHQANLYKKKPDRGSEHDWKDLTRDEFKVSKQWVCGGGVGWGVGAQAHL